MAADKVVYQIIAKEVKQNNRTNRFPGNFRSGSHDLHAEVSHPQHKGVMILQNGFNGHPQQPAVDQLAYRGPPGSMTNSGFSTRSATPTQSDDGSARQQQRSQHQPQSQAGVDTVRITNNSINGTATEQANFDLLPDGPRGATNATIDHNTASAGVQYNITGQTAGVLELIKFMKGGN